MAYCLFRISCQLDGFFIFIWCHLHRGRGKGSRIYPVSVASVFEPSRTVGHLLTPILAAFRHLLRGSGCVWGVRDGRVLGIPAIPSAPVPLSHFRGFIRAWGLGNSSCLTPLAGSASG